MNEEKISKISKQDHALAYLRQYIGFEKPKMSLVRQTFIF